MFKSFKTFQVVIFKILLILCCTEISLFLLKKNLLLSFVFFLLIILFLIIEICYYIKNAFLLYDKTIISILNNDFSSDFSKHKSYKNYANLFQLYETLKNKESLEISKDIIYRSILNNIDTGIIILKKEGEDWDVFLMNNYFSKHFDIPKITKWKYLKKFLPSLYQIIEKNDFKEVKIPLEISFKHQDAQLYVMQTSRSEIYDQDYFIILLNSIQNLIEKKEKQAWVNLMNVISHELLNSITPIRSISKNLQELVQQEVISTEDLEDVKNSVSTILRRSDHLQQFVESYRKLAMLPAPKKQSTELSKWIENGLKIMAILFEKENIEVINTISFDRLISIDNQQMEQVLINLLTNCIHALAGMEKKQIIISAEIKERRTFIMISDSGKGIEKEIQKKIFLPFFTTRKEGAGIGLTLSKSIIESHGGYLTYRIINKKTTFSICLLDE